MADARPPKPDPESAARASTALEYGATHVLALSQLSDLADLPDGSAGGDGAPPLPALPVGQSQEMLAVPSQFAPSVPGGSQPSQFAPASQVVAAAAPSFVEAGGIATGGGGARRGRTACERSPPARPPPASAPTSAPGDESDVDAATAAAVALASPRTVAAAVAAAAAVNGTAAGLRSPPRAHRDRRRGPMDEMRQLVRILVKLIPHSAPHVAVGDDGGGNRLSEDQIKAFLAATLGDGAPRPPWGVPAGWAAYLADLYTWVRGGARVSVEDAAATARRDPGRSWEAVPSALARLGLHPRTWPLPLTEVGLAAARDHPIDQCGDGCAGDASGGGSAFASPAGKRRRAAPAADGGGGGAPPAAAPAPPAPRGATALDLRELDETELWRAAATALALAGERAGTTAPPALPALAALKAHVAATAARLAGDAPPLVSSAPVSAAASPARPRLPERGAAPSPGGRKARGGAVTRAPSD